MVDYSKEIDDLNYKNDQESVKFNQKRLKLLILNEINKNFEELISTLKIK